jgi:hypothetical protein
MEPKRDRDKKLLGTLICAACALGVFVGFGVISSPKLSSPQSSEVTCLVPETLKEVPCSPNSNVVVYAPHHDLDPGIIVSTSPLGDGNFDPWILRRSCRHWMRDNCVDPPVAGRIGVAPR